MPGGSVINVSQRATPDKGFFGARVGALGSRSVLAVDGGQRTALEL